MTLYKKIISILFIMGFCGIITIPTLLTDFKGGKLSFPENRTLASSPVLKLEDGTINPNYNADFEDWFNDNVGLRKYMYILDARIQYYIFNQLAPGDNYLGPNGELNYAEDFMIESYAHTNLYSDEELQKFATGLQKINDYLADKDIYYFYFQCYDKHSIYPEQFMTGINQYGDLSATDQVTNYFKEHTTVNVLSPKEILINSKDTYNSYSTWGDPSHWSQRGAFMGYQLMIDEINKTTNKNYKVLTEDDFEITLNDQGKYMLGAIHEEDIEELFELKDPKAYQTDEQPIFLSSFADKGRYIYVNDYVDNEDTLVILGDSYFEYFVFPYMAESFHKTVYMLGPYTEELETIIDYYKPTIIISENAERAPRYDNLVNCAAKLP